MDHRFSGTLSFKSLLFSFSFDGRRLSLFPTSAGEEKEIERTWLKEEIAPWLLAGPRYPKIDTDFLAGIRNEDGHKIIFLVNKGSDVGYKTAPRCTVLYIPVYAYIDCKFERASICKISFSGPEINLIHPANKAYELKINPDEWSKQGKVSIETTDFDASQTDKRVFKSDESEISVYFAVSRSIGNGIDHPAVAFTSNLIFELKETNDFKFICDLCSIAEQFIRYLCYRDNIRFSEVKLSAPFKDGLTEPFATMHLLWQPEESEVRAIEKRRLIGQRHINGYEGVLLNDISNEALYMRHFPTSFSKADQITPASFLMLVAAFEWEFKRLHPEGIAKSESRIDAENDVEQTIEMLIDESSGKAKGIYKFLKKLIRSDSLRDKLIKIEEDVTPSIGKIGQSLYKREGIAFNFAGIGERISSQRNAFAHGDLNRAFNEETLVDIGYLKIIVYAMQLKITGLSDDGIRDAIGQLFGVHG